MPRRLIPDAHEWIKEDPPLLFSILLRLRRGERAAIAQRGKKSLLRLTKPRVCGIACGM